MKTSAITLFAVATVVALGVAGLARARRESQAKCEATPGAITLIYKSGMRMCVYGDGMVLP